MIQISLYSHPLLPPSIIFVNRVTRAVTFFLSFRLCTGMPMMFFLFLLLFELFSFLHVFFSFTQYGRKLYQDKNRFNRCHVYLNQKVCSRVDSVIVVLLLSFNTWKHLGLSSSWSSELINILICFLVIGLLTKTS